jgi:sec-independent protein translocase protein TatA
LRRLNRRAYNEAIFSSSLYVYRITLEREEMDFFGIGFGEIVLILIIALIVFGPGKLPEIARTVGKAYRNFVKTSSEFTAAVKKEMDLEEAKKEGRAGKDEGGTSHEKPTGTDKKPAGGSN